VRPDPDRWFSLAPCSPPSRPLRAASGGGLRPVLTAVARGVLPEGRSGQRDGSVRSNKGMLALVCAQPSPPPVTDLLNLTHTTCKNLRHFGSPHRVRPISRTIETGAFYPAMDDTSVLPCRDVRLVMKAARKEVVAVLWGGIG
jgi:hypothetical protein